MKTHRTRKLERYTLDTAAYLLRILIAVSSDLIPDGEMVSLLVLVQSF